MSLLRKFSITAKIVTISSVLAAIFLGGAFIYGLLKSRQSLADAKVEVFEISVENEKNKVQDYTKAIRATALAISGTPPFQGIIRARNNDGFDEKDNSTIEQWRDRLETIFIAELESQAAFSQMRYIDESGEEFVRVNQTPDGPIAVSDIDLQNKASRSYFRETNKLSKGQVYVSRTELNREGENNQISIPYQPTIRYAVPVFDEVSGERRGIFIINVAVDKLIDETRIKSTERGEIYIADENGYFINHKDDAKRWGGENNLGTGVNIFSEFQELSESIFAQDSGTFISGDDIFVYAKSLPDSADPSRFWIIIERASKASVFAAVNEIVRISILIGSLIFILLFFIFLFSIKRLLKPLEELVHASEKLGKGDFSQKVKIRSNDEVGKLADAFNKTSNQLQNLYGNLEEKVAIRTKELSDSRNELEEKLEELKRLNKTMVNRELKMVELKKEIENLKKKDGGQ